MYRLSRGVAARSAIYTWRHLSLPLPASTNTLPRTLPLQLAALRSYCSHSHLPSSTRASPSLQQAARATLPTQPLRHYSRKQKRRERTSQKSGKEELSNKDARALQQLKSEHRSTEQRLVAEAVEEQRENRDAAMATLEPLTAQQRTELQAEVRRLQNNDPLPTRDAQRLSELSGILQLDASRQTRQQQHQQRFSIRATSAAASAEPYDHTGTGDSPISLDGLNDPAYQKLKALYTAEAAERNSARKKRPNRKPFNPLPAHYMMDDAADIPSEVQMDRAEWEEVDDDDQQRVRTYMGLQRLRRNEQKLQRILQMAKPSKLDLLLLLNEVDALEGKDRRFMERYVGGKMGWDEMESEFEAAFDWNEREEEDVPDLEGDSDRVQKARALREQQENQEGGEDEDGEGQAEERSLSVEADAPKLNAAGVNVREEFEEQDRMERIEAAEQKRRAAVDSRDDEEEAPTADELSSQRLFEQWEAMKQRQAAEGATAAIEPRGAMLVDERHRAEFRELALLNPAAYEIDHEDDEYHEPELDPEDELELDLTLDAQERQRAAAQKADRRSESELAQAAKDNADKVRELAGDETVQAVFGKDGLELLMKDKLTGADEARMRELIAADESELDALQSLSTVWRLKQEMVAEWRALVRETGGELDERAVHDFMQEDDASVEAAYRAEHDVLAELDEIEQREFGRAIQAARKQKRWIADQVQRVGEQRVRQAVKDGVLQLRTHAAVQSAMADVLAEAIAQGQDETAQLAEIMEMELGGLNEQLADVFGVRPEDVKKLSEGQQVDEAKLFLSADELAKRTAEALPAENERLERLVEANLNEWFERDLLAEAEAAEAEGDALAATKLRLMHARRAEHDSKPIARQSSISGDQLRAKGSILGSGEGGARTVQHALYGRTSVQEVEVNRKLVARGDEHNERFIDAVDEEDESNALQAGFDESQGAEAKDSNALAAEWAALSAEKRAAVSDAIEKEETEANEEFDDFVMSQLPIQLHRKAVREWHKLSAADQRALIERGRENREELRHWIWERANRYGEEGESVDPLGQYWIDEQDPKLHGAVEGAFWHVGRWGLDERTEAQKRASDGKRIVRRHAPLTPDTQTLLDEAEMKLFPPRQGGEDEDDDTREVDLDVREEGGDRPRLEAGSAIDAVGSGEADRDMSELAELFELQPEAADEFDVLNNEAPKELDDDEEEEEEAGQRKQGGDAVRSGSEEDAQQQEEEMTGGGGREEASLLVRDKDGYIEYYDDGETIYDEAEEAVAAQEDDEVDEDDEEEVEVERDPTNDLDDDQFNPRLAKHEAERNERRRAFSDLDPVPTGDQRAFDDQYFHYDEDEYELMARLDPYGEEDDNYRKPQSAETVWNEYTLDDEKGQHVLAEDTRRALFLLHQSNPAVWTPAALAMKFRMSHQHVKGILMIEAAAERAIDHGLEEEDRALEETEDSEAAQGVDEYRALVRRIKFRESLVRRGDNGEMIELADREDTNEVIPEAMLHYLPRLPHPRVPDVRFVNENDMASVLEEERDVEERFLSQQARLAKREAEHFAKQGPIGATTAPRYARKADPADNYQQPAVLRDGKLLPPIPHHLVMLDISERRQDRYSMAVRDVTGWLREPTPIEFVNTRKRERSEKARFVYAQYRQERNTPV